MQGIFPNEVGEWMKRGALIIDVHGPEEYARGHLPSEVNIPLGELQPIPEWTAAPVVVVCASGGRSARAAVVLEETGHFDVATLPGGTFGWMQENRPIEIAEVGIDGKR
ncbi:rhodanese-like domain-containing protein [Deinococcus rubellus]|uniref:rhodanese-like domain-containing protein n=1 Tax=Deinococcus rubellus TaxID=1889240 RepID=UPI0031E7893F